MNHPILGEITREKEEGKARVLYGGRSIEFVFHADGGPYDAVVEMAASVAQHLDRFDAAAKRVAASDLTGTYNEDWNEYDQAQGDGTFKTITNPELTQVEFARKLTLEGVNVTGDMVDFFYNDENMFWGHCVIVTSMDGIAFTDTYAVVSG